MSKGFVQTMHHPLFVHMQVFLLTSVFVCVCACACMCVCDDTVQPTESIKEIMKMCVTLLTVVWSSEYYGSHYQITKLTWQATHQPTQTVHGKQHLIQSLTAQHCLLEGIWAIANGLSPIIKLLSQMSRKYYTHKIFPTLSKHHTLESIGQIQMSYYSWRIVPRTNNTSHQINRTDVNSMKD